MANTTTPSRRDRPSPAAAGGKRISFSGAPDLPDFLSEARNSPEAHRRNFEDAQKAHQRVLEAALHVYELHQLAEANREIEVEEIRRKERVVEEERRIAKERQAKIKQLEDEARLAAQKAAPLPKPVVPVLPPPAEPPAAPAAASAAPPVPAPPVPATSLDAMKSLQSLLNPTTAAPASNPFGAPRPTEQKAAAPSSFSNAVQPPAAKPVKIPPVAAAAKPAPTAQPVVVDRYMQIHKNLKELRKFVAEQAKSNALLKQRMGDMRRDIRKSLGQLTSGGLRENKIPVARLVTVLHAGLKEVPSELLDPNQFLLEPINAPVQDALRNEPQLPSLFLYLLNIMAKAAIAQFVNESGADTRTAEAIGQAVVKVYSEAEFLWRGKPMIDMLIAKYRIVCPVLFGFRGNDRTEHGRAVVGWKKENGRWIAEQYHMDRMTGLGAGFAALTLRDFSRVKRPNPWPPSVYWTALAKIVNTPPQDMSETQCYVLKAMIANNEARFMTFYGHAAIAALKCALVDYPARAVKPTSGTETLKVLAKSLAMKTGLDLERI